MSFPGTIWGHYGQEKQTSTDQKHPLGTRMVFPDGRVFRYFKAGEAIGAGHLLMQAAGVANHDMDLTVAAAAAVGDSTITVDLGATAATANQYAGGYIYINDANGEGHIYAIKSNPAADSSAELTVTLEDGETVREALVVDTSLAGLMVNPYNGLEDFDVSDIDGPCLGVACTEVASGSYGWCTTWGWAAVLSGAQVPVLGDPVMPADTAADDASVEVLDIATVAQTVGVAALIAPVDTDYGMIFVTISP